MKTHVIGGHVGRIIAERLSDLDVKPIPSAEVLAAALRDHLTAPRHAESALQYPFN